MAEKLGIPVLDIDDHHLEPYWGVSIAKKVTQLAELSKINTLDSMSNTHKENIQPFMAQTNTFTDRVYSRCCHVVAYSVSFLY